MRRIKSALCLIILISVCACGIDNTMFNARNYFKSAQNRPLNNMGRPTAQAVDEYTKAIKKCGMILSDGGKDPRAHDALFLMARALYYKGNSAFQAKDAFENLIAGYPDSRHIPDAYIYLARVMRDINQPAESERILEQFILNPIYQKHHPKALMVLADFEIKDKDYHRAQFWLERIIRDYPQTKEFKEASFLFGKNYFMQKDYQRSLEEFVKINRARKIEKTLKLEAQYYIALNELELGRVASALKTVKSLIRNEVRPDKLSAARVLYARCLFANGEHEAGLAEIDAVTKTYLRTEQSAEAYYHLGEYYYYKMGDIPNAVSNLNRVRTEFSNSPYAQIATQKAQALNQLLPNPNLNSVTNLQQFLDHHYLRAEYFITPLALPDSAFYAYQKVIDERLVLVAHRDTLVLEMNYLQARLDSLSVLPGLMTVEPDSVISDPKASPDFEAEENEAGPELEAEPSELQDESEIFEPLDDAESSVPGHDPLISPETQIQEDEEDAQEAEAADDQTKEDAPPAPEPKDINLDEPQQPTQAQASELANEQLQTLQNQITTLRAKIENLDGVIGRFDSEIIPFCYFAQVSLLHNNLGDFSRRDEIFARMQAAYPRNKFSVAAAMVLEDKIPELLDPDYNSARQEFDRVLGFWPEQPDSLVIALQSFTKSEY
ncbi:MAG TPA: tetratricopeptide repeat protein, partial [Candidatus Cloacimonadota bacterium]|nr:tetratricopeptide repeat protein [Candidatus Cloacimonadota bacterium]